MQSKKELKRIKRYLEQYLLKISLLPKIVKCDKCNRYSLSDNDCFSLEYCRLMKIPFTCGSCKFPQYRDSLNTSVRGNVGIIYNKPTITRKCN